MAEIETRGSATLHLTTEEFETLRDRVRSTQPESELARVLAEAEPTDGPRLESVIEEVDGVDMQVEVRVLAYAITLPPGDVNLAEHALRADANPIADAVAEYELPADPPAIPISDNGLILPA